MNRYTNSNILVRGFHLFVIALLLVGAFSLTPGRAAQAATRQWHTFMGSSSYDYCSDIALDVSGNVYVAGGSDATWGLPVNAHSVGDHDAFVTKIVSDSDGGGGCFITTSAR